MPKNHESVENISVNHSLMMALSYVFGQGLYFVVIATLLFTGHKETAGWISVKVAYISFAMQLSDVGTLNVIARAWHEKAKPHVNELIAARGVLSFISGLVLASVAYFTGDHDIVFIFLLPFACAIAGMSLVFEYELNGNYYLFSILQSIQWIMVLIFCALEVLIWDAGGALLYIPLLIMLCFNGGWRNSTRLALKFSGLFEFAPIFIVSMIGQIWGRLIVQLIYANFGAQTVSVYTLIRGVLAGLVKFTTNIIRPIFLNEYFQRKNKNYIFLQKTLLLIAFFQLIVVAFGYFIVAQHELILFFLWPFWTIYTWHSMQVIYFLRPEKLLMLEIVSTVIMVGVFQLLLKVNPFMATFFSDLFKVVIYALVILFYNKLMQSKSENINL